MGEHALTPEERPLAFTYNSSRDEALHLLVASLWDEQTAGDPACDTAFSPVSATTSPTQTCFSLVGQRARAYRNDVADIAGHFIIIVDRNLHVTVEEYNSRDEADRAISSGMETT
jgi:hypothetical protein